MNRTTTSPLVCSRAIHCPSITEIFSYTSSNRTYRAWESEKKYNADFCVQKKIKLMVRLGIQIATPLYPPPYQGGNRRVRRKTAPIPSTRYLPIVRKSYLNITPKRCSFTYRINCQRRI